MQSLDTLKLPELLCNCLDGTTAATQGVVARLLAAILQCDEHREPYPQPQPQPQS